MTIQDWAALIVAILTIVSSIGLSIKWLVKHYLSELKSNGGSSMRDDIKNIKKNQLDAEEKQYRMGLKLDKMYDILLDHIAKNSK
jgi:hypothetical protein